MQTVQHAVGKHVAIFGPVMQPCWSRQSRHDDVSVLLHQEADISGHVVIAAHEHLSHYGHENHTLGMYVRDAFDMMSSSRPSGHRIPTLSSTCIIAIF